MRTSILLFFLLLGICSNSKASDKTSRYGDASYWFQSARETDITPKAKKTHKNNIFFISCLT